MNYIQVQPSVGWAWGRNRFVQVRGLHLDFGLTESEFPGVEMVSLHPLSARGIVGWSSYMMFDAPTLTALAETWLKQVGRLVLDPKQPVVDVNVCPECGSTEVEGEPYEDLPNGQVHQVIRCLACGRKWSAAYTLTSIMLLPKGTEE